MIHQSFGINYSYYLDYNAVFYNLNELVTIGIPTYFFNCNFTVIIV